MAGIFSCFYSIILLQLCFSQASKGLSTTEASHLVNETSKSLNRTSTNNFTTTIATSVSDGQTNMAQSTSLAPATNRIGIKFMNNQAGDILEYVETEGERVEFDCEVVHKRSMHIRWQKFDKEFESISYRIIKRKDKPQWKLQMSNLLSADSGNYSCIVSNGASKVIRTFILHVTAKKETKKPVIKELSLSNISLQVGESVKMECDAITEFKYAIPYIRWEKHMKFNLVHNSTNNTFYKDFMDTLYKTDDIESRFKNSRYSIVHASDSIEIIEERQLERTFSSKLVLNSVKLDDNAEYSCTAFNDVGYSKRSTFLHVYPAPKPSKLELALIYAMKYGKSKSSNSQPLSVLVCLPVGLFVLLTIGFVWWREHTMHKKDKNHITLLDIKHMREIDNFSSLEHIRDEHLDKCSSQVNKQHSVCTGEGYRESPDADEEDEHLSNGDDENLQLLGNGNHLSQINNKNGKNIEEQTPEYIPMQVISPACSDTPTGRHSTLESHEELEWEPVDLELNISLDKQNSKCLDAQV